MTSDQLNSKSPEEIFGDLFLKESHRVWDYEDLAKYVGLLAKVTNTNSAQLGLSWLAASSITLKAPLSGLVVHLGTTVTLVDGTGFPTCFFPGLEQISQRCESNEGSKLSKASYKSVQDHSATNTRRLGKQAVEVDATHKLVKHLKRKVLLKDASTNAFMDAASGKTNDSKLLRASVWELWVRTDVSARSFKTKVSARIINRFLVGSATLLPSWRKTFSPIPGSIAGNKPSQEQHQSSSHVSRSTTSESFKMPYVNRANSVKEDYLGDSLSFPIMAKDVEEYIRIVREPNPLHRTCQFQDEQYLQQFVSPEIMGSFQLVPGIFSLALTEHVTRVFSDDVSVTYTDPGTVFSANAPICDLNSPSVEMENAIERPSARESFLKTGALEVPRCCERELRASFSAPLHADTTVNVYSKELKSQYGKHVQILSSTHGACD